MKTYLLNIIPKIKEYSKKIDDVSILTNKHWVAIDESTDVKAIYIFRGNNQLLISVNGKVEKAQWEYVGNNSLLIEMNNQCYLYKHGFLDENILALKVDNTNEYVPFVNENNYDGELNSIEAIEDFLSNRYLKSKNPNEIEQGTIYNPNTVRITTDKGLLEIRIWDKHRIAYSYGDFVFLNNKPAPDGKYIHGWPAWLCTITVSGGRITKL